MLTINNTLDGYLKDVEIKGNTIQDTSNLADIRSVGDKVEGQELYEIPVLSRGKNLFNGKWERGYALNLEPSSPLYGKTQVGENYSTTQDFIKVSPNETYYFTDTTAQRWVVFYDKDKKPISHDQRWSNCVTPNNTAYIKFYDHNTRVDAFPNYSVSTIDNVYEPYQEDKLTILSPVQLEKVGDVADRIIYKDGVWGVEKNIGTIVLNGTQTFNYITTTNGFGKFRYDISNGVKFTSLLATIVSSNFNSVEWTSPTKEQIQYGNGLTSNIGGIGLIVNNISSTTELNNYLKVTPITIKYQLGTPQFIPLPHDQQIKLRTFANKTNISFLTEIEGTIKAQVPKSLGATVNTHTTQIDNLNKELDRVKKLEESIVSTVETENDFTTVETTSNGYFEDVKLEGKTLVNLAKQPTNNGSINNQYATISTVTNIKPSTEYTYIIRNNGSEMLKLYLNNNGGFDWFDLDVEVNSTVIGKAKTLPTIDGDIWLSLSKDETMEQNLKVVLLEGDHTQNPPSFFEGLKSVGEDTDEIVVSSVNENLFDASQHIPNGWSNGNMITTSNYRSYWIKCKPNTTYFIESDRSGNRFGVCCSNIIKFGGEAFPVTKGAVFGSDDDTDKIVSTLFTTDNTARYLFVYTVNNGVFPTPKIMISKSDTQINYIEPNRDKKRLLFYNEETQTWEKPILREWDSIERHADGKYYYHQRSGEVVLNGSENWSLAGTPNQANSKVFSVICNGMTSLHFDKATVIADKFKTVNTTSEYNLDDSEYMCCSGSKIYTRILNTKLSTQDVAGFKQWLQTNNVTVVYQLAQEKVYECTNIDLITYANETNYIVESGAIIPRSTLKVHNNISNVVSLLQKKVSLLESNMTKYMITQNRMQLASTYSADSVTFKVDYALCSEETEEYNEDLYNLILHNILVGKDNYDYDKMFTMILDYASWNQISWEQFDILVGLMDIQHNPPVEDEVIEDETLIAE